MDAWRTVHLGEVCEINRKSYGVKEGWEFVNYLDTGNITDNKIDRLQYINLQLDKLPSRARRKTKKNSIIYSTVRPIQRHFGIIKSQPENFLISTGFVVIDVNEEVLDADFLYYWLTQKTVTETLQAIAEQGQSTYPAIKPSDLAGLELHLPPISVQKRIAGILACLDRKIELNMQLNENLAEQIKEICTRCFSDRSLFNRVLPNDWSKTTLAAVANFISGYSYKGNELADSNVAMATIKNFDRKRGFKLDGYKEIVPSGKLKETQHVELFDTLVAHTDLTQNAAVIGNAELVISKSNYDDIIFSMDLVKVIPKEKRISKFLIAAILQDERFKTHCLGYINGTTVLHLSKKALPEYPIYLPNDLSALIPLDKIFTNLYQQIAINIEENLNLQILRDILLIKLMSETRDILR